MQRLPVSCVLDHVFLKVVGFITSFHLKNGDNLLPIHINNLIRQRDFF